MAGDWIKMRVNLATHPKVLAIAEHLASNEDYQDWSTMTGFAPALGGTRAEAERDFVASLRVTRYVTVCALLRFWGYANEHARDEFIATLRVSDVDEIVQVPGFGAALASVGWALFDEERRGIALPDFNEFNTSGHERSATAKSNAERQREYRARLKSSESNDERCNESDATRNRREDKRREEEIREEKEEKRETAPRKRAAPFLVPEWINRDHWDAWHSCSKRRNATDKQKQLAVDKLTAWRAEGIDHAAALENAAIGGWQGLFKPDEQKAGGGSAVNKQEALEQRNRGVASSWAAGIGNYV